MTDAPIESQKQVDNIEKIEETNKVALTVLVEFHEDDHTLEDDAFEHVENALFTANKIDDNIKRVKLSEADRQHNITIRASRDYLGLNWKQQKLHEIDLKEKNGEEE